VLKVLGVACVVSSLLGAFQPMSTAAYAADTFIQVADSAADYPIQPSEAASIARDAYPDSKVLNVKLLPNGVYAVTLKAGGSVSRVMVDATSGAIS
jgi:uncharacterized membrane protein YkoI